MTIVCAKYIVTCNKKFEILKNSAICFDKYIIDIGLKKDLIQKYPNAKVISYDKNTILMPGLINTHIHLEFCANKSTLKYGNFVNWLKSVIKHREELISKCDKNAIDKVLKDILKSGVTTIGAISSFGFDLDSCVESELNVIYFNEILGSNPDMIDQSFEEFLKRFELSLGYKSKNFIPSISIHSPYSTHPNLIKKVLQIAKEKDLVVSTHFLESEAEKEWLESGSGEFREFFDSFSPNSKPVNSRSSYIELFKDVKTIFTHVLFANESELEKMKFISHCPISNRLLSDKKLSLDIKPLITIGTDGLSSNISLNLWDELRVALFIHDKWQLNTLSKWLLSFVTRNAALALGINSGSLEIGKDADIIAVKMEQNIEYEQDLILQILLHTKKANDVFIFGKRVC